MSKKAARTTPMVAGGRGGRGRRAPRPKIARKASRSFRLVLCGAFVVLLIVSAATFEAQPIKSSAGARVLATRAAR